MLPSILAGQLRATVLDYLTTTFGLSDREFEESLLAFLNGDSGLFRGPYYEVRLPFRRESKEANTPLEVRPPFQPYRHQALAFDRLTSAHGHQPQHTLIVTGTGSGKTECFLYPILDHCLRHKDEPGIKAILLYPMNALASDQAHRLAELIHGDDRLRGSVTAGMYVGGKGRYAVMGPDHLVDQREALRDDPPDILLTNYRMLDFLLLRPHDAKLWRHNTEETLRYLVLDELHTYDGAQGTDVAFLLRRLRLRLGCAKGAVCCVGTSATIATSSDGTGGTGHEPLIEFAKTLFDDYFARDCVVTEDRASALEVLGESADLEHFPGDELPLLLPSSYEDQEQWLESQASLWLGEGATAQDPVGLGERLSRHPLLHLLVRSLGGGPLSFDVLSSELARWSEAWGQIPKEWHRPALDSFLAVVSRARRRDQSAGGENRTLPFLTVQVHLWIRELSRLLQLVTADPKDRTFRFDSDPDPEANLHSTRHWLPLLWCRECGGHGLASSQPVGTPSLDTDAATINKNWVHGTANSQAIFDAGSHSSATGDPGVSVRLLCPQCLSLSENDAHSSHEGGSCQCWARVGETAGAKRRVLVSEVKGNAKSRGEKRQPKRTCPLCSSQDALVMMGSRAATLLSVTVSQLLSSEHNRDRKLLAFTDSVQDASHRAGFFGARTYTFNLRSAIQATIASWEKDHEAPLALEQASTAVLDHWTKRMEPTFLYAALLPPDLTGLDEWKRVLERWQAQRGGAEEERKTEAVRPSEFLDILEPRLQWEVQRELGLDSKTGRTLEWVGCAALGFDANRLGKAAERLHLELEEESWFGSSLDLADGPRPDVGVMSHLLLHLLHRMRQRGALDHPWLRPYFEWGGSRYLLSRKRQPYLSPFPEHAVLPKILVEGTHRVFDPIDSSHRYTWLRNWVSRCLGVNATGPGAVDFLRMVMRVLVSEGLVTELQCQKGGSGARHRGFVLNPSAAWLTTHTKRLVCGECRRERVVAKDEAAQLLERPCPSYRCPGSLREQSESTSKARERHDYYQRLYASDHLERVVCAEHTGLLARKNREDLEAEFRVGKVPGSPNVLVCTPTLEMGIDIGDLSATLLCSVPPTPASYLQRLGRAGRKTGNALSVTMAASRPHDLYFHNEPLSMLRGQVLPPGAYLEAPEMLLRQFAAFAMDQWAKERAESGISIPGKMGMILDDKEAPERAFPQTFGRYYREHFDSMWEAFSEGFCPADEGTRSELRSSLLTESVPQRFQAAFAEVAEELKELQSIARRTRQRARKIEEDPAISERPEEELRELNDSSRVLGRLTKELRGQYPLQVLTDAGALPNYAFPERGVAFESVVRKEAKKQGTATLQTSPKGQMGESDFETRKYVRPAHTAIRELAPHNTFYAEGLRVRIDQIDIGTQAQPLLEYWRFCPDCSHSERELEERDSEPGSRSASCPRCKHEGWADSGQVRAVVPFRRARALSKLIEATAAVSREDRERQYYEVARLVDVGPENALGGFMLPKLPFGWERLERVPLREVNFGVDRSASEQSFRVADKAIHEAGFPVCARCGHVRPAAGGDEGKRDLRHTPWCPGRREGAKETFVEVALYRQIESEALRILLPVATEDVNRKRASFKAALQLGIRRLLGGQASHLELTESDEPANRLESGGARRRYVLLYDKVPGGTGQLAHLAEPKTFTRLLRTAHRALTTCECQRGESDRDGCYQCLFAFQVQRDLPVLSSHAAREMIDQVLEQIEGGELTSTDSLSNASIDDLIESELEAKFLDVLRRFAHKNGTELERSIKGGRPRWVLRLRSELGADGQEQPGRSWEIRQQVDIGPRQGVERASRPDFVIAPRDGDPGVLPIAVFCDGAAFHVTPEKNPGVLAADVAKRGALLASERYRVWSLTWSDLEAWIANEDGASDEAFAAPTARALSQLWDQRATGPLTQSVLTRGSLGLLFTHLQTSEGSHWSALSEAVVGAWATQDRFLGGQDSADLRERLLRDPNDLTAYPLEILERPNPDDLFVSRAQLGAHAALVARLPVDSIRRGVAEGAEIVIRLLDHQPHRQERNFVAWWRSFLWSWNLLQFHHGAEFVSSEYLESEEASFRYDPPAASSQLVAEPSAGSASQGDQAQLEEVLELATSWSAPVIQKAFELSLPLPEPGFWLGGAGQHEADIAWPDEKIAVLAEAQAGSRHAFERAGFLVFEYPVNAEELLRELAERLSAVPV